MKQGLLVIGPGPKVGECLKEEWLCNVIKKVSIGQWPMSKIRFR